MRTPLCASVAIGFVLSVAGPSRADDQAEGKAIIDKAIKALGGEAKLAKLNAISFQAKGVAQHDQNKQEFALEGSLHGFDQIRVDFEVDIGVGKKKALLVLNRDTAWFMDKDTGMVQEDKQAAAAFKHVFYAMRAPQMLVPLRDKGFALSPLGEVKVGDRPTIGVRVTHKDHKDLNLFFDKETGLPAKTETTSRDPRDMEVKLEFLFADYKEFDGIKHFTKITVKTEVGGRQVSAELEITQVKPQEKLDDSLFAKP